jgi:phage baseplate assembly protein gpV
LDGTYVLTSVDHEFNRDTGFVSELSSEPMETSSRIGSPVVVLGIVSSVQDPESRGRVRVTLPALGGIESEWMGVITAGAGAGKGMLMLPDVNDNVVVVLTADDPSVGFVIGGLYGTNGPDDYGVEGSGVKRYSFASPGGQKIRLDDTSSTIRVENRAGSFVEFGPQKAFLHATTDLTIEAPGQTILVRGKAIDFEEA